MKSNRTRILLSIAAVTALALPAGAAARHGADDPAGHVRHGADDAPGHVRHGADDSTHAKHKVKHSSRTSDDRRGRGRGSDDGPNHT